MLPAHVPLNPPPACPSLRPRGWHLEEKHFTVDGENSSGSLFDFGLYMYHNAKQSLAIGSGPYFYLPKMESHLEARSVLCKGGGGRVMGQTLAQGWVITGKNPLQCFC